MRKLDGPDLGAPEFPSIEDFRIIDQIGSGTSATVYRVTKGLLPENFALKRWHDASGGDSLRKFADECRLQLDLSDHPNIVRLLWCQATPGQRPWLVTQLFDESLADRLERGPLESGEADTIIDDALAGLGAIHDRDHVHRDIKPANIMLKDGRAAIGDLGLVLRLGEQTTANAAGTFPYVAPELVAGQTPTKRSDVYSMATTIARIFGSELPSHVIRILDRAQSINPLDRPCDANELRVEICTARRDAKVLEKHATQSGVTSASIDSITTSEQPGEARGFERALQASRKTWTAFAITATIAIVVISLALWPSNASKKPSPPLTTYCRVAPKISGVPKRSEPGSEVTATVYAPCPVPSDMIQLMVVSLISDGPYHKIFFYSKGVVYTSQDSAKYTMTFDSPNTTRSIYIVSIPRNAWMRIKSTSADKVSAMAYHGAFAQRYLSARSSFRVSQTIQNTTTS